MTAARWATAVAWLCCAPFPVLAADAVWPALHAPGSVVVLRHSFAPGGFDPPGARLDDCSTQRNLDENGRAQARRIGEAFRRLMHGEGEADEELLGDGIAFKGVARYPVRVKCALLGWMAFDAVEPINVAGRIAAGLKKPEGIDGNDAEALHAAALAWTGGR